MTLLHAVVLALLVACVCLSVSGRSNTQRAWLASQPALTAGDLDADGVDEWILVDGAALFVVAADYRAIGKAYTLAPFEQDASISSVLLGNFLGRTQPRLLCALAPGGRTPAATNVSCGLLHPARFEVQWVVRNQALPFLVADRRSNSSAPGSDAIVGDFDGDGRDELLLYSPTDGSFASYSLRVASSATSYEFALQSAAIAVSDSVAAGSTTYTLARTGQEVYIGNFFDCTCPASSTSGIGEANPSARCVGFLRRSNSTSVLPAEAVWAEPPIPEAPPDINAAPRRAYTLDTTTPINTYATDDLILVDRARGVAQGLASCVAPATLNSRTPTFVRVLATGAGFVAAAARISVARVRGLDDTHDLVLHNPTAAVGLKLYSVAWDPLAGGRFERLSQSAGDLGRLLRKLKAQGTTGELAWMRVQKPRVIQPATTSALPTIPSAPAPAASSTSTSSSSYFSAASPTPASSSYLRSDAVVWNPARQLLHFFAATFVASVPQDRTAPPPATELEALSPATSGSQRLAVDADAASLSNFTAASLGSPPDAWLGERTFVFVFAQAMLQLDADQDGDALLTRHELGGLDPSRTGVSVAPLHSYACSPFRRDVLVEVDFMEDSVKSMRPRDGFHVPARDDLARHGIALHAFVDQAMPRVDNLGGTSFDWARDFEPLKRAHFTPTRVGLFHYCVFIDRFDGGSVSGQSARVPGNDFFISLGGWEGGRGTLVQQSGTFLHELGHNLNLLHGGGDDVNWKPNHLSVMNYAFQVVGIERDGQASLVLSDMDCADLDEQALDEFDGVQCTLGAASQGHAYSTLIDGRWFPINQPLDFNQNNKLEHAVSYDLNGETLGVLRGSPNEFSRMSFGGLDPIPANATAWASGTLGTDQANISPRPGEPTPHATSALSRQLLAADDQQPHAPQRELTFEQFVEMSSSPHAPHALLSSLASALWSAADPRRWFHDLISPP